MKQFQKNSLIMPLCPFESAKCEKEGEKLQESDISQSFLDEIKNIFHSP